MQIFIDKKIQMIRQTTFIIFFFVLFCFSYNLRAQNGFLANNNISQSTIDTIKKYALTYPNETQFSVAIIKNDTVSFIGVKKRFGNLISIK